MGKFVWRYYLPYRPPMPGAQPREGLDRVASFEQRQQFDGIGCWGYAEYTRELSDKEIRDYELIPSKNNPLEY